jgi:phosphosulfolactate phosphohydrolase-like enzyme
LIGAHRGDAGASGSSVAVASAPGTVNPADDDVLVADEMAVMLDDEPAKVEEKPAQPTPKGRRKKSVPPPLPRG